MATNDDVIHLIRLLDQKKKKHTFVCGTWHKKNYSVIESKKREHAAHGINFILYITFIIDCCWMKIEGHHSNQFNWELNLIPAIGFIRLIAFIVIISMVNKRYCVFYGHFHLVTFLLFIQLFIFFFFTYL